MENVPTPDEARRGIEAAENIVSAVETYLSPRGD
jgi:hypothetical protein